MFHTLRQSLFSGTRLAALVSFWAVASAPSALSAQDLRLLMIERPGCYYCIVFKRDVAPIYYKSPEGQRAPLVHADLRYPLPDGVTLSSRAHVTPTFVLLNAEGHEVERLTGYPGDDFFWPYVNAMITRALPEGDAELAP